LRQENKCVSCWTELDPELKRCLPCHEKKNAYARKIKGFNPYGTTNRGRTPQVWDDDSKKWVSPLFLRMKEMDWSMSNVEIAYHAKVTTPTVAVYRKVFGPSASKALDPTKLHLIAKAIKDKAFKKISCRTKMQLVDWKMDNGEIAFRANVCEKTVRKYRKIYGFEYVFSPSKKVRKRKKIFREEVKHVDWSMSNTEIALLYKRDRATVLAYRKIYGGKYSKKKDQRRTKQEMKK
jgi:hypothetical protein